ncbi:hypothetical protein GIB67_007187 [Kingdonia uniflora]|uniref:AAA+ ATPase domain-containing protein n=1 Tax=Kingdonia uniflora TaxID=39325 RepID=A0A7J7NE01_9MAGN|nr:hypothetical protein GIB67_007187 [Kingdonia uniflora]
MEMATIAAEYVATTAAKYTSDPALRHIGATTMEGAAIAVPIVRYISYVASTAAQYAWDHIGYFLYYQTYVNDLQNKVQEDLLRLEHDVIGKVNLARDNGDVIHEVVQNWLNMVVEVRDEALILFNQAEEINSCFKGWGSTSHRIGKESKEKIAIIKNLLIEGRSFSSVSDPAPVPTRVAEHFDAFASREATKKEVIKALKDSNTNLIGVYGMGGVGKTTLMKEIRKQVEETKLFDKVVLATVSQNADFRGIQTQIAESLGMKKILSAILKQESIEARAAILSARLKQEKNILLILDDLRKRLELIDVGITLSKVIIISRSLDVCNSMGTTKNIEVKVLSKKDSLELFRQEVGDIDFDAQREMSEEIVNECGGLPLAIVTLARALRKKDKSVWTDVIPQLRMSMYEGMDIVNASIKMSYNFLKTRETKLCFLLCALFPERMTLNILVGYAMGEDLLGDGETLKEARGNLRIMLNSLVSSGLLLRWYDGRLFFMMHDIVRDAAISIARENRNESIMSAGLGLQKWPKLKEAGKCLRLSLMSNDIREVPADAPECSQLVTLSLASNKSLADIPDGFFEDMKRLATLDLSNIGIFSLPNSLSSLNNCLRSLYLDDCTKLQDISLIGNLKTLEILSLQRTIGISRLPEEMSRLRNLKMLDLSYNQNLKCIPPKVISRLCSLEELYMRYSYREWEIEGTGDNASLAEAASLINLTSLDFSIQNPKWLSTDIGPSHHWEKLEKFNIRMGYSTTIYGRITTKSERCVVLRTRSDCYPVAAWVNVLMGRTYELYLEECEGLKNVLQLNPKGFYNLKFLSLDDCGEMEYVVNIEEQVPETMFPNLEILKLHHLPKLKAIWNGSMTIRLPRLRILSLRKLPRLLSFFSLRRKLPGVLLECPSLETLVIQMCPYLKKLPFGPQSTPKLEEFDIENELFQGMEWDDPSVKSQLQQLLPHPPEHKDKGYSSSLSSDSPGNQGVAPRLPPTKDILSWSNAPNCRAWIKVNNPWPWLWEVRSWYSTFVIPILLGHLPTLLIQPIREEGSLAKLKCARDLM